MRTPAPLLRESFDKGRASILFSATLTPPGYYARVLGLEDGVRISCPSPFPPHHMGLFLADKLDLRYEAREESAPQAAGLLHTFCRGRKGNYMFFFSSYEYMDVVLNHFRQLYDGSILVQQPGMDDAARQEFLACFREEPRDTTVGFCVMGGIYGEGIDLAGSRLIGAAILGMGMPPPGLRRECIRRRFESEGYGFDFAYRYPGLNKVLQAAGRVIRTPLDKGAVLLMDSRFAWDATQKMFPAHWPAPQKVGPEDLGEKLAVFWQQQNTDES